MPMALDSIRSTKHANSRTFLSTKSKVINVLIAEPLFHPWFIFLESFHYQQMVESGIHKPISYKISVTISTLF